MTEDNHFHPDLTDYEFPEVIITAEITSYTPERSAPPCSDHDSPRFSDEGDAANCEYNLHGFLRFEPDDVSDEGDPVGLLISLTTAQIEEIAEHFDLGQQIKDEAERIYYEEEEV